DVLVVPRANPEEYVEYVREEQAGDYPEGRYELALQVAAEAGDQRDLDALFARRSSAQMLRLCVLLLIVMALLAVAMNVLNQSVALATRKRQPGATATHSEIQLPALGDYPPLSAEARQQLTHALGELVHSKRLADATEGQSVEELLAVLRARVASAEMSAN